MKGLTLKQRKILNFIESFIEQHNYSPSYREIMQQFEFSSPGSIYKYIQTLKKKGALESVKHSHRSINPLKKTVLIKEESKEMQLPLIGYLSSGYPLELFASHQTLSVPASFVHDPDNTYILQAQGDSLQEEAIQSGDYLLIEARQEIHPGEIILGLINQQNSILKRYFPEGKYIRLESQNANQPPLTVRSDHILIQGVLVGLLRLF